MKWFTVALLALAAVSATSAEVTVLEMDDDPLQIPTESEFMQTVVASSPDDLYRYNILVSEPDDRQKVKDFVNVVVESRRRLSGTVAAQEMETLENLDLVVHVRCTIAVASSISNLDYVKSVVMDLGMYASAQYNWGNDRTDQDKFPASRTYSPLATGKGQRVYVIDTGITINHEEFAFGTRAVHGWDFVDGDGDATDGHSHGTHCAGSAVGKTIGMAPDAIAVGIRVLGNSGGGSSWDVIRGMEWATADAIDRGIVGIFSLSLGGPADNGLDNSVTMASTKGMIPVVAAGNSAADACNYSPARSTGGITVGATNDADGIAYFSNWGACVDIFAPGRSIVSASNSGPNAYRVKSGTSMAAPHVAGAVAVLLELLGGKADLNTIMDLLESIGGHNYIKGSIGNAPNLLLRVPAKSETFNGRSTTAPLKPTPKPTKRPSKSPTTSQPVMMVDKKQKNFLPSAIGPVYDPDRSLNGYLVVEKSNANGCKEFSEELTGHVALIKRGGCSFFHKVLHAQNSGAEGVVVYDSVAGEPLLEMGYGGDSSSLHIPSFFINLEDGTAIVNSIASGQPGHLYLGHPATYVAPGESRTHFTENPTRAPVQKAVTKSPTRDTSNNPVAEPCETYKYYSHCMATDYPPRWTKCVWDLEKKKCSVRTAMPCSQHRLWKTCNMHGDVCEYKSGSGCVERPVSERKPLPTPGPQCLDHSNEANCNNDKISCFWISAPAYQRGCFSRGGGGILEAGGPPDEPYTPKSCNYGTYWQAHNYCEHNEMRLCSAYELRADRGSLTNVSKKEATCDVTKRYMWTNARCGVSSVRTYYEDTDTVRCQTIPSWRSRAGFRCCQDIPQTPESN